MAELLIPDVEEAILQRLRERASAHRRSAELEAKTILADALQPAKRDPWAVIDAIRQELAATGRDFGDSTKSIRDDRERHSILDIPPVSLGAVLRPFNADDDVLGEMLESRS